MIAYPTEAVFGLGCDAADQEACEKIIQLKNRDPEQGLISLVGDWHFLQDWVIGLDPALLLQLNAPQPRPTTWLIPTTPLAPKWLRGRHETIAVRRPTWPPLLAFCNEFGKPLVSTSANPHGQAAATSAQEVSNYFGDRLDLIWDRSCGGVASVSQIIDLRSGKVMR